MFKCVGRGGVVCLAVICAAACAAQEPSGLKFSKRCLMLSPNEGCAIGDINQDGKPDIVAGTHWFPAPDFIPHPIRDIPESPKEYYASNGDLLYDVDGDGRLDVISMGWVEPEITWYKNPGPEGLLRGWKWEAHVLAKSAGRNEAAALRDLDGDGVPELVISCWNKKDPLVAWKFAKDGKGQPILQRIVVGAEGGGHGYAFGDVNGDGREDLLTEVGWYERPAGNPLAGPWKFHAETALAHPSAPFLVRDVNGDGRNDIIWGKAHDFGLYWWEQGPPQPDGATTWKEHLIDDSWSQPHCLVMADLDGDGREELITGKRVRAHNGKDPGGNDPECLWYYTWDPKQLKCTRHAISPLGGGVGAGMQICVADLNGDGRPDIAVGGKTGTWLLFNEGK